MTQLTQRQLERCELCLLPPCFCYICIIGQKKARDVSEKSSGAWPAPVRTTEQRRSPVNRCSLLAALVGISCNTGTQTLAVPTKIAVACVCVTIFDKRSDINLQGGKKKKSRWLNCMSCANSSCSIFSRSFTSGLIERIKHKNKVFFKVWAYSYKKSTFQMTSLYLSYRSKEKFSQWLLTCLSTHLLFIDFKELWKLALLLS